MRYSIYFKELREGCGCGCFKCKAKRRKSTTEVAQGGSGSGAGRPSAPNHQLGQYKDPYDPAPTHYSSRAFRAMIRKMKNKYGSKSKMEARVLMRKLRRVRRMKQKGSRWLRY